ncbi:suppressor of glycerol defect [Coemansia javaensis]|uniref:Suppressor of glycerol defect n=1 Tax=Coemansia javaensis TaxID=2761396 RepID=A0A9W8HE26_9FUNG|nr:suppressor of glycerol defect [Coemansia javaensis]
MPPKRRLQGNAVLPAELADKVAAHGAGDEKRFAKRFKNAAATRKAARKQARADKKQRKNEHHKRMHGFSMPAGRTPGRAGPVGGAKRGASASSAASAAKADTQKKKQQPQRPAEKKAPAPQGDERAQLLKFAKRNKGMYALLRESNLVGDVDKEAGVTSAAAAAEELEDRELRRLERNLGIKSNDKLAAAFFDEGLGDILAGIDYGSSSVRNKSRPATARGPGQESAGATGGSGAMEDSDDGAMDDADGGDVDESGDDAMRGGSDTDEAVSDDSSDSGADSDESVGADDDGDDDDDAFGLNAFASDGEDGTESEDSDIAEMYRSQGIDTNPNLSEDDGDASGSEDSDASGSEDGDASGSEDGDASGSEDGDASGSEDGDQGKGAAPAGPSVSRYIPPSLRRKQAADEAEDECVASIRKTLQGQLNRLSESNIEGIVAQIEAQYQKHPRHHVTEVLCGLILQAIRSRTHMLDTFLYVNAAVVGAMYRAVGLDPVAHLVQKLMEEFEQQFAQGLADFRAGQDQEAKDGDDDDGAAGGAGKECQNLCVFVAELYNFQIISCQLVYDVIRLCIQDVNEFTAELLLKLIRTSGLQLRKDDPLALKEVVRQATETVGSVGTGRLSVRCRFMVESLTSLKDNRMRNAMSQSADNVARLKKFLANMDKRRPGGAAEPINIGLQDIRDIKTKGKWWLVGASWVGSQYTGDGPAPGAAQAAARRAQDESSNADMERLLKMAKAQHMNTDIRRSVFVTLLSSDDYADAFERLLKLDLKKTQARELMRVIIHCCGQEKAYNPYYTLVAYKLCAYHNTYQLTMQYALWDFMRELGETDVGGLGRLSQDDGGDGGGGGATVPLRRIVNLAKMYAWLVDRQVLSLLILKTVTFAKVGRQARVFFQVMFSTLFLLHKQRSEADLKAVYGVFQRAASNPTMCHGMLFFFHHFVKRCDLVDEADLPAVRWGCKIAKQAIRDHVGGTSLDAM